MRRITSLSSKHGKCEHKRIARMDTCLAYICMDCNLIITDAYLDKIKKTKIGKELLKRIGWS